MQTKDLARLTALAAVVTVFLGKAVTGTANATTYVGGTLTNVMLWGPGNPTSAMLTGTDLRGWSYNDVANSLTASDLFQEHYTAGTLTAYTQTTSGL